MIIQGKTIWITGASSGIGEALAVELFNRGATVILTARNEGKLHTLQSRLGGIEQGRCHVVACDVTRSEAVIQAIEQVKRFVDRIDILINNAGVSQRSYAMETTLEVDRELFEVNFFSAVALTKHMLPWMISTGGGMIVVMSSMAGKYGFRMRSAYSASKHALHGFFETLRAEVHDKKVRVLMVCPGRIRTDISLNCLTGDGKRYGKMDPGQLQGIPVERCVRIIARAIQHNRKEILIGRAEVFLLVVKRICPPLYYWIVNRASPT